MATIAARTITFPGLENVYTLPVVDSSLSVEGAAADAAAVRALIDSSVIASTNYGSELPTTNLVEGRVFYKI
jgi:hypothetical protein